MFRQREDPFDPTSIINDKDGNPLADDANIIHRWREYFEVLLSPNKDQNHEETFQPRHQDETAPPILESEVQVSLEPVLKAKHDITAEAIRQACLYVGVLGCPGLFVSLCVGGVLGVGMSGFVC